MKIRAEILLIGLLVVVTAAWGIARQRAWDEHLNARRALSEKASCAEHAWIDQKIHELEAQGCDTFRITIDGINPDGDGFYSHLYHIQPDGTVKKWEPFPPKEP